MYAGLLLNALGNVVVPAATGLASNQVGPREQGKMQGALSSLTTLCAAVGTLMATSLFAWFTGPHAPIYLPGAPYYFGVILYLAALVAAYVSVKPVSRAT